MATWSEAFAVQATSDYETYLLLSRSTLANNHRLHYLQMWLEKLCKSYLWKLEVNAEALKLKHNVIARVLPNLLKEHWRRIGFERPPDIRELRKLCREIDLLHPQVDDENRRPDNVEYPWRGTSGTIEIPARWKFPVASKLESNLGRLLLKAADWLTHNSAVFIK